MNQYLDEMKKWSRDLRGLADSLQLDSKLLDEWEREFEEFQLEIEDRDLSNEEIYQLAQEFYENLKMQFLALGFRVEGNPEQARQVPIGGHTLPPLPYAYNALEPYISEEIMRLHHQKHHKSYVDGLNKAERELQRMRETNNFDLIKHWERELAFNGAGHYLHTIFWNIMNPKGGGKPRGMVLSQINRDFGSFEKFKQHFSQAAEKVEGVGWAVLIYSPRSQRLEILQAEKHQNLTQWDDLPLLVLDVWEHAYYLQYKNERKKYIDNWWNVVYWPEVEKRFEEARRLKWDARIS